MIILLRGLIQSKVSLNGDKISALSYSLLIILTGSNAFMSSAQFVRINGRAVIFSCRQLFEELSATDIWLIIRHGAINA